MSMKDKIFYALFCWDCNKFVCYGSNGYVTVYCQECQPEREGESRIKIEGV